MKTTRDPWPNKLGFDILDRHGNELGDVFNSSRKFVISTSAGAISAKGKWLKLERRIEILDCDLDPSTLTDEVLLNLADTLGEELS